MFSWCVSDCGWFGVGICIMLFEIWLVLVVVAVLVAVGCCFGVTVGLLRCWFASLVFDLLVSMMR